MDAILAFFKNDIFIQTVGFIGMAACLIATQCKTYKRIALFRILGELIFALQFLFLGAYTGAVTNFASCFTNSVYGYRIRKGKSTLPFQIAFGILFVGLGILTWTGPATLLAVGAKLISTVALGINNPRTIRILNCFSSPLWIIYDVIFFTLGGVISDSLVLLFAIAAVIRIDVLKK